jgi:hypothetical protein
MPSTATLTAVEYNAAAAVIPAPVLNWASLNTGVFTVPSAGSGGQTAIVTAAGVGTANGTCTDPTTSVVGGFTVNVASSLGIVVIPTGVYLAATVPALAGGGSGFPILGIRLRLLVDCMLGSNPGFSIWIGGSSDTIAMSTIVSGGNVDFRGTFTASGAVGQDFGQVAQSSLPVAGTFVDFYAVYLASGPTGAFLLATDAGAVLFTGSLTGSALGFTAHSNTDPTFTTVWIGNSTHSSPPEGGITVDGVEITAALISNPTLPPAPSDPAGIIDWGFAGFLTPSLFGAGTLAPVGGSVTYLSGGIWS